jgi:hypothetical protein
MHFFESGAGLSVCECEEEEEGCGDIKVCGAVFCCCIV